MCRCLQVQYVAKGKANWRTLEYKHAHSAQQLCTAIGMHHGSNVVRKPLRLKIIMDSSSSPSLSVLGRPIRQKLSLEGTRIEPGQSHISSRLLTGNAMSRARPTRAARHRQSVRIHKGHTPQTEVPMEFVTKPESFGRLFQFSHPCREASCIYLQQWEITYSTKPVQLLGHNVRNQLGEPSCPEDMS